MGKQNEPSSVVLGRNEIAMSRHEAGKGEVMRRNDLKSEAQAWAMVGLWVCGIALATLAWHHMVT